MELKMESAASAAAQSLEGLKNSATSAGAVLQKQTADIADNMKQTINTMSGAAVEINKNAASVGQTFGVFDKTLNQIAVNIKNSSETLTDNIKNMSPAIRDASMKLKTELAKTAEETASSFEKFSSSVESAGKHIEKFKQSLVLKKSNPENSNNNGEKRSV